MHSMIVGLSQMTATSAILSALLPKDDTLAPLRLNFRAELEGSPDDPVYWSDKGAFEAPKELAPTSFDVQRSGTR